MPQIAAVVTIVAAVAQVATSLRAGQEEKEAAKREQDQRQRRLQLQQQQRNLEKQRREAQLRRESRRRTASIVNRSFAQGARFSTSFAGATSAIAAGQARESTFLSQTEALASQADAITSEQINDDAARRRSNATQSQISGAFQGLGTAASALGSLNLGGGGEDAIDFFETASAAAR